MENSTSKYQSGLDRKEAEEALEAFLESNNEAKVFAIKGDWGIGKTHLVRTFLAKIQEEYHYASVFGVSTVDELRVQLWSNFRSGKQVKSSEVNRFNPRNWFKPIKDNSQNIGSLIEAIPTIGDYGAGFTPAIIALLSNLVLNNSLQKKLICIDDLERRSGKFPLDELLGFIENLAEEKECKVILIYNESKIAKDPQASNTLKEYREKVINYEIKLDPDSVENFHIGFGNIDPDEDIVLNYLSRENLQVNNIRVFKKLKWNLEKLRPYIVDFLPRVRKRIIDEIIFISLSKLDNNFPVNLDELVSLGDFSKPLSEREEGGRDIYFLASSLGYTNSEISSEIIRLVETSFCDYQRFYGEGNRLNDRESQHEIREKLHEAYRPYSESFESVEEELRKNLIEFLDHYWNYLDFRELQELKSISEVIDLDINFYAEKWVRHQIDHSDNLDDLYRLQEILQENHVFEDKNLMTDLDDKILGFEKEMSIDAIFVKVLKTKGWSRRDANFLNARTPEQWERWLLERHPDKPFMVRQGLGMGEKFSETLREVITDLAKKSKLNAMRAEKIYRIDRESIKSSKA
ncbi:MAG: P-loop NTPase fold protein [Cyanobacteria bacterium]|nr:P-loop NTPase fold protein [Cyanobacteriota bacterium]